MWGWNAAVLHSSQLPGLAGWSSWSPLFLQDSALALSSIPLGMAISSRSHGAGVQDENPDPGWGWQEGTPGEQPLAEELWGWLWPIGLWARLGATLASGGWGHCVLMLVLDAAPSALVGSEEAEELARSTALPAALLLSWQGWRCPRAPPWAQQVPVSGTRQHQGTKGVLSAGGDKDTGFAVMGVWQDQGHKAMASGLCAGFSAGIFQKASRQSRTEGWGSHWVLPA